MINKGIAAIALFACVISCKKKEDGEPETGLIGKWTLVEVLSDPGDGSGTFQPVTSDKTISFFEDGTVESNGDLCNMSIESSGPTSGTYNETTSRIDPNGCDPLWYELNGSELIVSYPCIEPCKAKYIE